VAGDRGKLPISRDEQQLALAQGKRLALIAQKLKS